MATSYAAYSVYYYEDTPPYDGHGMAGRILDAGASFVVAYPNLRSTNLNGDPKVEGFTDTGNALRLAVTDYVTGSARPVYIYDPVAAANLATPTWTNVQNLYTLTRLGSYLYALDYDNARVVQIDPSNYSETGKTFSLAGSGLPLPSGYTPYGQALIVAGSDLYGLFAFADSTWSNYASSMLVRFTISGTGITVGPTDYNNTLEKNAFSLAAYGSDLYIAAIGGAQGSSGVSNPDSRVQKISIAGALNGATVTPVLTQSDFAYEYRDISFDAGGNAYVLMGTYDSSWNLVGKLVKVTAFSPLASTDIDTFSTTPGYFWSAQYTADNNRIWFARGNAIRVYDASSFTTPAATLTLSVNGPGNLGGLLGSGDLYDNINDLTYIGATGTRASLRGYRSPLQVSNTPRARAARGLTRGRPELTEDELEQLDD
ncbi:hypothetical protein [Pseudothauera rhizosphaerae]|uniref:Uncharacterized protein n=1 Tax=Pseudothauera rhizosphaerae TaxID=2565932 RepID=A0A4S4AMJ6_9RHOO|nr:hypothetical protein [Pseudothauera rhizosphaerae]THF60283.1 hypothetical protein E6O51_13815 [Pseudothauera rhizosphaerae]